MKQQLMSLGIVLEQYILLSPLTRSDAITADKHKCLRHEQEWC